MRFKFGDKIKIRDDIIVTYAITYSGWKGRFVCKSETEKDIVLVCEDVAYRMHKDDFATLISCSYRIQGKYLVLDKKMNAKSLNI